MRNFLGCKVVMAASFIAAFHLAAGLAMAQKPGVVANEDAGMTPMLIAVGLVVIVSLSAFINPKRSHLN